MDRGVSFAGYHAYSKDGIKLDVRYWGQKVTPGVIPSSCSRQALNPHVVILNKQSD
jgi:hypothetical protein